MEVKTLPAVSLLNFLWLMVSCSLPQRQLLRYSLMSASVAAAINTICIGPVFLPLSFEMEIGDLKKKFTSAIL